MSQKSQDAIDVLSEVIVDTIDKKLGTAKFDKSQTGVVTAVNGNTYTIAVFGSQYNITSDQIFTVGQSVVVTALQGDMKRLVCSPDNVGTMKTVDSKVKVVGDQLSSFIDKDFADTVIRYTDVGKFFNIKDKANTDLATFKTEYDSDLKVTKEQIEARVTATTYTEDMSSLKKRVSTAESRITQTEKDITLRVEKDDYTGEKLVSMISAQPESVKISAKNIELTGAVTIQNGQTVLNSESVNNSITEIDGSKIKTGTIDAEKIKAGTITATEIKADTITAGNIASGQIIRMLWQNATAGTYKGSNGVVIPFQMSTFPAQLIDFEFSDLSQIQIIFKGNRFQSGGDNDKNCFSFSSMLVPLFDFGDDNAGSDNAIFYTASVPLPSSRDRAESEEFFVPSDTPAFSFRSFQVHYSKNSSGSGYLSIYFWDAAIQDQDGSVSYGENYNDWCIPYRIYGMK